MGIGRVKPFGAFFISKRRRHERLRKGSIQFQSMAKNARRLRRKRGRIVRAVQSKGTDRAGRDRTSQDTECTTGASHASSVRYQVAIDISDAEFPGRMRVKY